MTIHFAPLEVPVHRRLQTAAVVQWVFSFLGLGEYASNLNRSPGSWWLWWDVGGVFTSGQINCACTGC